MKWVTIEHDGRVKHGYVDGDLIRITGDGDLMATVRGEGTTDAVAQPPLNGARILAPLLAPGKVIAAAANYQEHVAEGGGKEREKATASPRLFLKPATSIVGPDAEITLNPITRELDWEVELAVIVGEGGRDIPLESALDHVFGYASSNDISARSLALGIERDGEAWTGFFDWLEGKWLDGSAPLGPYLVSADEVPDPQALALTLTVNGVVHQNSTTAGMIHSVAELIAFSSRLMTLQPGDVILTGTPAGVGAASGTFLAAGDVMVAELENLGRLTTTVVAPA